ncbi:MAG: HAMP domain-containing sensor histidine kinase [Hyphomicrobium sp.]|nr:HAMP domain-containing sensor histidine kinase [Hyphomicrobium sp.]
MAWTSSATPRGASARADAIDRGQTAASGSSTNAAFGRTGLLEAAALANLGAIAYAVLSHGAHPISILPVATGLALVVVAILNTRPATDAAAERGDGAFEDFDAGQLAIERQSQRLMELADAATRARREAEIREQLWSDLTARMSHELRTPLNAVIGFTDIMHAELLGPVGHDRYREYISHIRDSGRDLLKSSEDTLALTALLGAPDCGEAHTPLSLASVLTDAWSFFGASRVGGSPLIERHGFDGIEVVAGARPTRQLLINMLTEARVRAGAEGRVIVTARERSGTVELEITVPGGEPRPSHAPKSLSLSIARAIADLMGSSVTETVDADGTTWRLATTFDRAVQQDFFAGHTN